MCVCVVRLLGAIAFIHANHIFMEEVNERTRSEVDSHECYTCKEKERERKKSSGFFLYYFMPTNNNNNSKIYIELSVDDDAHQSILFI